MEATYFFCLKGLFEHLTDLKEGFQSTGIFVVDFVVDADYLVEEFKKIVDFVLKDEVNDHRRYSKSYILDRLN